MTLEEKINKIIGKYKLSPRMLENIHLGEKIQVWHGTELYTPWSIYYLTNPTEKSRSLLGAFLMVDMLICEADPKECTKSSSNYIRWIKKSFMEKHDFKKEWLKRYEIFEKVYLGKTR